MPAPLVSIVTPVFNGEKYIAECIESVLAQTYNAWVYTIVNNRSTDNTLEIARQYARQDRRICIVTNPLFVGAIENHNIALRHVSPSSRYCKLISADDWMYPECISRLVEFAELDREVGIVQAYVVNLNGVRWPSLPWDADTFDGRDIGRLYLLGKIEFAGIPSSLLYRSSLVRSRDPFFPCTTPSADAAACLECLQHCKFGVVRQILSFERIHDESITTRVAKLNSHLLDRLELLNNYGSMYLTPPELKGRSEEMLDQYFGMLASAVFRLERREFWAYHRRRLREDFGYACYGGKLGKAVFLKLLDLFLNPKQTIEKGMARVFRHNPSPATWESSVPHVRVKG
jgi:glycosyltransferase involved in cell wall biosynthesis